MNNKSKIQQVRLTPKSTTMILFFFLLMFSIRRFPPNFFEPNFFAEDGLVFWSNFQSDGFSSFVTPFNGYPVVGIYLLVAFSELVRFLLDGPISEAAFFLNFVGYAAWALFSLAPFLLLRRYFQSWVRVFLCLLFLFIPLDHYDFAILGVIGNLKAGFLPLSILLSLYILREESRLRSSIAHGLLVLCVWTNPIAVLSLGLLAKKLIRRELIARQYFIGNFSLLIFIFYQASILVHGVPRIDGYLDEPFQASNILSIVSRMLFYSFFHPFYGDLNDYLVVFLLLSSLGIVLKFAKSLRFEIWMVISIQFIAGVVLFTQRSGLSVFFSDYDYNAPSQFFYAFNWITILNIFLLLFKKESKLEGLKALLPFVFLVAEILPISGIASFGGNDSMHENLSSFESNLEQSCAIDPLPDRVQIFPFVELKLPLNLESICKDM